MVSENDVYKIPSEPMYVQAFKEVTKIPCPDDNTLYRYEIEESDILGKTAIKFTNEGYGLINVYNPYDSERILIKVCIAVLYVFNTNIN